MVGLLGVDSGLLWVVAGVFTVRGLAGTPVGAAWGVACVGAGVRWGTLGLGDVEVATRVLGTTLTAGRPVVRGGMAVAFIAALASECRIGALRAPTIAERAAAFIALVALTGAFCAPGVEAGRFWVSAVWWTVAAGALTAAALTAGPLVRRVPSWLAPSVAVAGAVVAGVGR